MQAALDFRVLSKQIPGPGEGIRSRFMTCQQQCHDFITQLLIAHLLPCLLITSLQEHREQVTLFGILLAMLSDDIMYDHIKRTNGPLNAAVARCGNG